MMGFFPALFHHRHERQQQQQEQQQQQQQQESDQGRNNDEKPNERHQNRRGIGVEKSPDDSSNTSTTTAAEADLSIGGDVALATTSSYDSEVCRAVEAEEWHKQPLHILVVGASGNFAKTKTYPALLELYRLGLLPKETVVWGFARTNGTTDEFRTDLAGHLSRDGHHLEGKRPHHKASNSAVDSFLRLCRYTPGNDYGDWRTLTNILDLARPGNLLVYLAIPPHVFGVATQSLKMSLKRLGSPVKGFVRIVLEKPFARDTPTCRNMLDVLRHQKWSEENLYRIDHYLGKEMVQNILTLRQHNMFLNTLFHKNSISSVHIIYKKECGLEGHGRYFDRNGIIRDVIQNHVLQILTLMAMELPPPENLAHGAIRDAKVDILKKMSPMSSDDCLLGQYAGYRDDETIENKVTVTPTYACVRVFVRNSRWDGVPFILEAGKAMDEDVCEVRMYMRGSSHSRPNALVVQMQPNPAVFFTANLKDPGYVSSDPVTTHLGVSFAPPKNQGAGGGKSPGIYARLLLNVLRGDQQYFVRDDELLEAWRVCTPLLTSASSEKPAPYDRGSDGPANRAAFLRSVGLNHPDLPQQAEF